jgi:hypothetical protein
VQLSTDPLAIEGQAAVTIRWRWVNGFAWLAALLLCVPVVWGAIVRPLLEFLADLLEYGW